ncbi:PAS domain-containing sensor histidine kinase [Temperatibacter marinus]|uniref:histidine kinase n=1 Tax=Temperatibacter marinus TaxID=1456591 RepID=A0AA52EFT1_9PROT|nr:PAS domain-containing sensor histidine kinase [Temperatibacter marinus]WND03930.1 PAS domain-containing sensor histidine kinase [Temperatibacter marinus]
MPLEQTIYVVGLIAIVLLAALFIVFYRLYKDKIQVTLLETQLDLFDRWLNTRSRQPLWVYEDGSLDYSKKALDLLNISTAPAHFSDLQNVFPHKIYAEIDLFIQSPSRGGTLTGFIFEREGNGTLSVTIDHIDKSPSGMPSYVVWLEKNPKRVTGAGDDLHEVKALKTQLDLTSGVLNTLSVPVWIWETSGTVLYVNNAYLKAVDGKSLDDVLSRKISLIEQKEPHRRDRIYRNVVENKRTTQERQYAIVEGQRRAYMVIHKSAPDQKSILSIAIDITAEEDALSELNRVLESQSVTLNRLASPVAIFGPDQRLTFYNQSFQRLTGVEETVLAERISHNDLLEEMRALRRLPEQVDFKQWKDNVLKQYVGLLEPVEETWHMPVGSTYRVLTQPHPLGGLLLLFEDMTDKLALEQSVHTLTAVQSQTLENLQEAVALFGSDGSLKLYNHGIVDLWNLQDLEGQVGTLVGMHVQQISDAALSALGLHSELEGVQSRILQANLDLFTQLSGWISQRDQRRENWRAPNDRIMEYSVVPLPDGSSLLTLTDITDSFNIQLALRERSQALETTARMKSDFIANMAYELRTPLNSIIGFSDLLIQGLYGSLKDQQIDTLGSVREAADGLNHLITNVLNIAVIDSGEAELAIEDVDLIEVFSLVEDMTLDQLRRRKSQMLWSVAEDVPTLELDGTRIKQMLYSLVSSIGNISKPKATISLSATLVDSESIQVSASIVRTLVDPYDLDSLRRTIDQERTVALQSAGSLDMTLVRSIVSIHNGYVTMHENQNENIEIQLTFPIKFIQ